jgi:sigma-B regulation protein RsbU (phosphoserine phosphatase)
MSGSAMAKVTGAEERFRLLLEAAPEAIVVTKRDGRIIRVNTQTERLFGYPREELLGQNVEVLLPQRVRDRHVKKRAAYFSHPRVRPMGAGRELYARRKDGTEFPVDVSFGSLETGGETLVSGFIRDITERKRSEELVSHLAAIVETSDDAIVGKSLDGTILSWNSGAERLYGYKAEEVVGRPLALLVPPDRTDEFAPIMKGLRHGQRFARLETTRLHKDGHPIEISVTISPVKGRAGTVIGASVIARDITERKRAEDLASHLASIVEASDDGIFVSSLDGTIVSWNSGAERLLGYTAEEVVGRPVAVLVPPDRADELGWIMKALRRGKHIEHYETTRVHKDGHRIDISVTVSPVKDKAGVVVGASVIARDITDRKRVEMALRQSEERFRVALKNAPVRVFNQDLELRFTWTNSHLLAWAKQDCLGKTDAEIVGGEEGARLTALKREVLRTGRGARTEAEVTVGCEKYYFDLVAEPLRDVNGTIVGLTCSATDITPTKKSLLEREGLIAKLQEALEEVKLLSGLLSICASCKKITNEHGDWEPMESYLQTHSQAKFSHGVCPDCLRKLYPEQYRAWEQEVQAGTGTGHASDIREARLRDDRTKK